MLFTQSKPQRLSTGSAHCLLALLVILLTGCSFKMKNLVKGDVDMIVDQHIQELNTLTARLLVKLYKRNPKELAKAPGKTIEKRRHQLAVPPPNYHFAELSREVGDGALSLAFNPNFSGDRVFALMVGLKSMLHGSYGMRTEIFLLDELNQQLLYHSARNLEIINWRLNNYRGDDGQLYLLSNGVQAGIANLSFERLFGKMILIQDMMAKVVSGKNNRTINTVVHSLASTVLLPIPL
tara:strand:+ start:50 stop:760 length:711 start_codon:yes stop_codon:yes gene_type:complete